MYCKFWISTCTDHKSPPNGTELSDLDFKEGCFFCGESCFPFLFGIFPVFWTSWFYLVVAAFWNFDFSTVCYSQHFGDWILHSHGICSI